MTVADRWFGHSGDKRKHFSHIFNLLFHFFVSIPLFKRAWKFSTVSCKLITGFNHLIDFRNNLRPWNFTPFSNGVLNFRVERVKFIKELNFLLSLDQKWVLNVRETKKNLTSIVRVVFTLADRVFVSVHAKTVKSFTRGNTRNSWTFLFEILSEFFNITNKVFNALD